MYQSVDQLIREFVYSFSSLEPGYAVRCAASLDEPLRTLLTVLCDVMSDG